MQLNKVINLLGICLLAAAFQSPLGRCGKTGDNNVEGRRSSDETSAEAEFRGVFEQGQSSGGESILAKKSALGRLRFYLAELRHESKPLYLFTISFVPASLVILFMGIVLCNRGGEHEALFEITNIKTAMQLMAKFKGLDCQANTLKSQVIKEFKGQLSQYCDSAYLSQFSLNECSGYLYETFCVSEKVLRKIQPGQSDYGKFRRLSLEEPDCALPMSVQAVRDCIFQVYAALYYVYFKSSDDGALKTALKGGAWNDHQINGCGCGDKKRRFFRWVTDKTCSDTGLMARGFSASALCSVSKGSDVAILIREGIDICAPRHMQNALAGMLFLGPWEHAKLGHSILFLHRLCVTVDNSGETCSTLMCKFEDILSSQKYQSFRALCIAIKPKLDPFVTGTILRAVCHGNASMYDAIFSDLSADRMENYLRWLAGNISGIIASLDQMAMESSNWTQSSLKYAASAGPFRFGFVFKDPWNGEPPSSALSRIISALTGNSANPLTGMMSAFKGYLDGLPLVGGLFRWLHLLKDPAAAASDEDSDTEEAAHGCPSAGAKPEASDTLQDLRDTLSGLSPAFISKDSCPKSKFGGVLIGIGIELLYIGAVVFWVFTGYLRMVRAL